MKKLYSVFTVCNAAYLDKTLALSESLYAIANIKTNIFVIDGKRDINFGKIESCIIRWVEELNIPNYKSLAFKYDIIEFSTCLKPFLAKLLLKESKKVIFFDPDVIVFNRMDSILEEMSIHPVMVTPHYLYPKREGEINDTRLMRFGFYNLGFFAVNDSDDAFKFLDWWELHCFEDCYMDSQYGIFTDQKWINIAIGFFPYIYSADNPGYNVAFWNVDQRKISIEHGRYVVNDKFPLVFFHYSAFNAKNPEKLSKRSFSIGENSPKTIAKLGLDYGSALQKYSIIVQDKTYTYDYFSDGSYISPVLRRSYASALDAFSIDVDPFDSNGPVTKFAKKNHLMTQNRKKYVAKGYNDISDKSIAKKMNLVYKCMRLLLILMGPNNYMNLSRLMVYLSSYHRVPDMWK